MMYKSHYLPAVSRVLTAALFFLAAAPAPAERYTVVMSGLPKGELVVAETGDDGVRRTFFSYRDRGRGPDLETISRVDEAGIPSSLEISGHDYRRMPVSEVFSVRDGTAKWKSRADDGAAPSGAYYFPASGNAEDTAALARALLLSPDRELDLLPAGRATVRCVDERDVSGPDGEISVSLCLIGGLDLQPATVWLDSDHELFAEGSVWLGVIREGYEEAQSELITAQEAALAADARAKAGDIARTPAGPLLIRNTKMFDAEHRRLLPRMSVLINGNRISAVAPDDELHIPPNTEVVEAHGKTLLPGLWDMHVHLISQSDGLLTMLAGITTVRDLGNDVEKLKLLADQFDSGALIGPRVLKAGLIDGSGEFAGPTKVLADTPQEMRTAINYYADLGYTMIKLYNSVDPALVSVAAETAHTRGLRLGGHPPAGMTAGDAVAAGYDEVQHGNFWLLNFMGPEVTARTNTPARFIDAYEKGYSVDPNGAAVRDFVAYLQDEGTVVDPTLVAFEMMFAAWKGELSGWIGPWVDRLPAGMRRSARSGGRATTPAELKQYRESFARMQQILLRLHRADVPIVVGTDGSGLLYARELKLHAEAGIAPEDVLYNATLGAARVMGLDGERGSIAVGKYADLVLIDGDPLRDIDEVRKTTLVIKGGVVHDATALSLAAGLLPPAPDD